MNARVQLHRVRLLCQSWAAVVIVAGLGSPLLGAERVAAHRGQALTLADNGRTRYSVAVTTGAIPAERHAARELARVLGEVTGAVFPIVDASKRGDGPALIVGAGAEAQKLIGEQPFRGVGKEGVIIETVGSDIVFTGGRPRGTLYAVYTFLEDVVGCRWWTPDISKIPYRPTLVIPAPHLRYVPRLEYREPFCRSEFDADWAVRNKVNGDGTGLDATHGGRIVYRDFCHSFERLVPADVYFSKHPEWFSERNGMRFHEGGQLCLTNDALQSFVAKRVIGWLRERPESDIVSVSQNDWGGRCECAKCRALEEKEGSPSGPLLHFVNTVAAAVEKEFPNVLISTFAYRYTRKAPKYVRPRHNVSVRLCSIECSFGRPLEAPGSRENKAFVRDLGEWAKICDRLYIWDYVANIKHFIPYPNLHVLGPNIRLFVKHGVKGVFAQGEGRARGYAMGGLRAWLLAKLMWRPQADEKGLIKDFVGGVFGPAADPIERYIELMSHAVQTTEAGLSGYSTASHPFLSLDVMAQAETLFEQAERAASKEPQFLERVQLARLPLRYVWAMRWDHLKQAAKARGLVWPGPRDYMENAETFLAIAKRNRLPADLVLSFEKTVLGSGRREAAAPPGCEGMPPSDYLDIQDGEFWLRQQDGVALVPDAAASDGVAARIPADCWAYADWIVWGFIAGLSLAGAGVYFFHPPAWPWLGPVGLVALLAIARLAGMVFPSGIAAAMGAGDALRTALGTGVFSLLALGAVLGAGVYMIRRQKRSRQRLTVAVRTRNALWGGLTGAAIAVALLSIAYNLGSVAHAAEGDRVMVRRFVESSYESMRPERMWKRRLSKLLAGAKTTVQRSSLRGLMARYCPADEDACDPLWAVSRPLCYPLVGGQGKVRFGAAIRCELTGRPGPAFEIGIYDPAARRSYVRREVRVEEMKGSGYHVVDLGAYRGKGSMYIWVAPPATGNAVRSVWIDRFFLVAETRKDLAQPQDGAR